MCSAVASSRRYDDAMPSPKEDAPKRPTIRDVAAVAGVSKSLVSRAFVDPQRVGSDSLKRINDAANRMGFAPSWSARTLNGPDGGFVGIVVSDLYSPAFAPMVIGAYRRLKSEGLDVLLSAASLSEPGADRTLEEAPIAFLRGLRPTKMIVIGRSRRARRRSGFDRRSLHRRRRRDGPRRGALDWTRTHPHHASCRYRTRRHSEVPGLRSGNECPRARPSDPR